MTYKSRHTRPHKQLEEILRRHVDRKFSYGEIAEEFSMTRSAVAGVCNRFKDHYQDGVLTMPKSSRLGADDLITALADALETTGTTDDWHLRLIQRARAQ